jgi:hypothetical protein
MFFIWIFLTTQFLLAMTTAEYIWNGTEWVSQEKEVNKIYLFLFCFERLFIVNSSLYI